MKGTKPQLVVDNSSLEQVPNAPSWLSKEAKAEWARTLPFLIEREILTGADLASFENYCVAIGHVRDTEAEIQACADPEFKLKLFRMQDKAAQSARLLAAELGLTPVSRSRPAIRKDKGDDENNPLDFS